MSPVHNGSELVAECKSKISKLLKQLQAQGGFISDTIFELIFFSFFDSFGCKGDAMADSSAQGAMAQNTDKLITQ